jgi:hypothetical protein
MKNAIMTPYRYPTDKLTQKKEQIRNPSELHNPNKLFPMVKFDDGQTMSGQ